MLPKFIIWLVKYNFQWSILKYVSMIGIKLQNARKHIDYLKKAPELTDILKNKVVIEGPFKGMKYSKQVKTFGTSIFNKLLGTYEREITPFIETIIKKNYKFIHDIGCAEGYYAEGLALKTKANVIAYDIDPIGRDF